MGKPIFSSWQTVIKVALQLEYSYPALACPALILNYKKYVKTIRYMHEIVFYLFYNFRIE